MKSLKVKICLIVALAVTAIVTLGIFLGNVAFANRYVTLSGTSIFNTSGNAQVWAHAVDTDAEGNTIEEWGNYYFYTMFTFEKNGDAVQYRRNLAYRWYFNVNDVDDYLDADKEDGDVENEPEDNETEKLPGAKGEGYFYMELGFEEANFQKFVIAFEAQQFSMTKDEKTTNYVIFVPTLDDDGNAKVYAVITDDKDVAEAKVEDIEVSGLVMLDIDHITIQLGECEHGVSGEYDVTVSNVGGETAQTGKFANVGKMYAKYVSSSTKPVIPLSFKAEFDEDEDGNLPEGQTRARMALYELNGQSFLLNRNADGEIVSTSRAITQHNDSDGSVHYTGGQVNDTQPPVLCLDAGISFVKENSELTFSYTAVDVLTQSPSTVTGFFMLTDKQHDDENFDPDNFEAKRLFKTVTSDEDVYIYPHANHYVPTTGDYVEGAFGEKLNPKAAIKIYLKLTDTSSTGGQSTYVFLDWFVEEEYKLTINGHDYIAVATDEEGATFNYGESEEDWNKLIAEYQAKVDEAAKDLRAGSDEDFYLPSLETLVSDNATAYKDMTFSIYYMVNGSTSSNAGRSSSQLYIDLTTDGDYIFTVYALDATNNSMWYIDEDGERVEFVAGDIWKMYDDVDEEGLKEKLPWFTFSAGISDISVEDPGEQSTAYYGVSYTASSFEVEGISTKTTYTLYRFNQSAYAEANGGKVLSYQEFMDSKKELFEEHREYFTNIVAQSELDANSEEYDQFYAYAWNPSSRSFIPQEANAFYLIQCEVTSTRFPTREAVRAYMGIAASATPAEIKGEDTWVQDNMVSIILLSIAAAAFIGIIILIFIKPKDKGDIDVQYEQEVAKKK